MERFFDLYDQLSETYPLYMKLEHLRSGITRWRLQVFGKNMAMAAGDAGIICVEAPTRQQVFEDGTKALTKRVEDLPRMKGGMR